MHEHPIRIYFLEHPSDWSPAPAGEPNEPGFTTLRTLLAPLNLCEEQLLTDEGLGRRLQDIENELRLNGVEADFLHKLPPRVAYRGLLRMQDAPLETPGPGRPVVRLTGCDGACESCFQLEYCSVAKLVLGRDWPFAVNQGHINPSWKALFSSEDP